MKKRECCLSPIRNHHMKTCPDGIMIAKLDEIFNGPGDLDRLVEWIGVQWKKLVHRA